MGQVRPLEFDSFAVDAAVRASEGVFSTEAIPPSERQSVWSDLIRRFSGPMSIEYGPELFNGHFMRRDLGGLACANIRQTTRRARRLPSQIRSYDEGHYFLVLQISGHSELRHPHAAVPLKPGELVIVDGAEASDISSTGKPHTEHVFVHLPREGIESHLAGRHLATDRALRGPSAALLASMLRPHFSLGASFSAAQRVAIRESLQLMVAASWGPLDVMEEAAADDGPAGASLLHAIQQHLLNHLTSSSLQPDAVASTFGISVRRVQRLFQTSGTTMSNWLRDRRIEACARALADPAQDALSITDIAFRFGFNDSAHFSRCFRVYFRCSPREYRAEQR